MKTVLLALLCISALACCGRHEAGTAEESEVEPLVGNSLRKGEQAAAASVAVVQSGLTQPSSPPVPPASATPFLQPEPSSSKPPVIVEEARPAVVPIAHERFIPSIYDAVRANDDVLIRALIEAGVPAHFRTPDGDTPLCLALRNGRPDLAIFLLLHGADPNVPGSGGHPPIALASLRRHPQLLRILLAAGADPNRRFGHPFTKSFLAIVQDEYLRDEMKHERDITPLMACAARGDVEGVSILLQWGADKQMHTMPHYRYAINFAADLRYLYVMRILLGRDPESEPRLLITVDLSKQKATLEIEGKIIAQTAVSTGRRGYGTPAGRYVITNKYKHWVSTLYDVPMPYFMRLNCGAIGLHSGYVTGRPASHGCIRLPHEMARKFFELANVGDEVAIEY